MFGYLRYNLAKQVYEPKEQNNDIQKLHEIYNDLYHQNESGNNHHQMLSKINETENFKVYLTTFCGNSQRRHLQHLRDSRYKIGQNQETSIKKSCKKNEQ